MKPGFTEVIFITQLILELAQNYENIAKFYLARNDNKSVSLFQKGEAICTDFVVNYLNTLTCQQAPKLEIIEKNALIIQGYLLTTGINAFERHDIQSAKNYAFELFRICQQCFSEKSKETADSYWFLGKIFHSNQFFKAAEIFLKKSLAIF